MLGRRPRLETPRHVRPPARQPRALGGGIATQVGDIVHRAAEGVDGVERFAPGAGQREERVVEVRATLAREAGAQATEAHARAAAMPCAVNHWTASRSATTGSVWGSPRSRMALAGLKYMRLRDMRTAVSGTAGGRPVSFATPSHAIALHQASAYGTLKRGGRPPVIEASS